MPYVRPPRLRGGDTVVVVAPGGPVDGARLARGCAVLEGLGVRVRLGTHVHRRDPRAVFLAGTDEERAEDLQRAWTDPAVRAVICARGGYGTQRLLAHLDWAALAATGPKVLLGSSDVTALHDAVAVRLGQATLFGPMPAGGVLGADAPDRTTLSHLRATLLAPGAAQVLRLRQFRCVVAGQATGPVVGGTLALLAASCGTAHARPAAGGIAFLEDVGEPLYRLDRYLTQLLSCGWFDDVRGVVLGTWAGCPADAASHVADRLAPLGVPVVTGLDAGHGPVQLTVPLGVAATLDARAGTLTYAEPALA